MSSQLIRWLHLSDFHVGKDNYAVRRMFEYILAHVGQRKINGFIPDFVFVTGDLANKGLQSEYDEFWLEFAQPLQETIGGDIAKRTFVVSGNHDVDRDQHPAFSREEMSAPKSHYFDPTEEGRKLRTILLPRFHAFSSSDQTRARDNLQSTLGCFVSVVELNGRKIGVAGINTAWLSKDDQDERKLKPGKPLLETALKELAVAEIRFVLGHHPLEWFIRDHQKPLKSLLGHNSVLYLHGHLHEAWAEPSNGGGYEFLTIQSGAAFQAREGERWRNGLVWGEVHLDSNEVRLQPWRWTPDQQGWTIAADVFPETLRRDVWWIYPLPGTGIAKRLAPPSPPSLLQPPKGWTIASPEELQGYVQPLDEDTAIRFFNGAVPSWRTALSTSIPQRDIVRTLVSRFEDAEAASRSILTLLLAAGCEGKTTAMLQAAFLVVQGKPIWRILRRVDDAQTLNLSEILRILNKQFYWLVVLDEADRTAESLLSLVRQLPPELQGRVHFLIACRDSDWQAARAFDLGWSSACIFQQESLIGLGERDAVAIVNSWAVFGKQGLGDLAKVPEHQWATVLVHQAREEAKTATGAFFGALLSVRHGSDLPNHARLMLERLGLRPIPSGGTLRDALAYIAAMHGEGLEFLSRPVLAHVLGCPVEKLHRDVLAPLGQEAAATSTSSFIFTRHRCVAEAVVSVLQSDFAEDISELFVGIAEAAITAGNEGSYVSVNLSRWRYGLAEHFFESSRRELALRIARKILSCEPFNSKTIVNLANLYRQAEVPEKAIELFRAVPATVTMERGFYFEWATA